MINKLSAANIRNVFAGIQSTGAFPSARERFGLINGRSVEREMSWVISSPAKDFGLTGIKETKLNILSIGARSLDVAQAFALLNLDGYSRISSFDIIDKDPDDAAFAISVTRMAGLPGKAVIADLRSPGLRKSYDIFVTRESIGDLFQYTPETFLSLAQMNTNAPGTKRFYFAEWSTSLSEDSMFFAGLERAGFRMTLKKFDEDPSVFPYRYVAVLDIKVDAKK